MVIQIFILGYMFIHEKHRIKKNFLIALIIINFMVIVGTGNRGGFIVFLAGCLLFYYFFKKEIGIKRIIGSIMIFGFLFTIVSIVMINFTPYDSIFKRLEKTEIKKGIPDTRKKVWEISYEGFKQKPILGWGPKIDIIGIPEFKEINDGKKTKDYSSIPSPHSLYLFLLYTLGVIGLFAYLIFFGFIYTFLIKSKNINCADPFLYGLPKLGIVILTVFIFDQIKLEFLRHTLHDYQHYIFMIFAAFIAFSDLKKKSTDYKA
jgi:O-antigen ligase